MASKKNRSNNNAPAGFKKIETRLAGFWKPEGEGEFIQGIVGSPIEARGADGKPNQFFPLRLTIAEQGLSVESSDGKPLEELAEGLMVGIGGKMLLGFLSDHVGKEVYLVYRGLGKAKPGQSAPKMYDTYAREDE